MLFRAIDANRREAKSATSSWKAVRCGRRT